MEVVGSNGKLILRHAGTNATKIASLNNAGDGVADLVFETYNKVTAKIHSGGNFEISDGNLVVASGHGIDFSATADATGHSSSLLADYEEGSWTPVLNKSGATGSVDSYTNQVGKYVRVGKLLWISFYLYKGSGSFGTGTGEWYVS